MKDKHNREINYMRVSVTDRCNYRCVYCMPENGVRLMDAAQILTYEEITKVIEIAAQLGISRIKLTGGEPLVRNGLPKLVGMIKKIEGIEQVTLTTNGYFLESYIDELADNGLDAVNISIDSPDPERYALITGGGDLGRVLKGMEAAVAKGMKVKINSVLFNDEDWKQMIFFAKDNTVDVRFIEVMPIGKGKEMSGISKEEVLAFMKREGICYSKDMSSHGNGPAEYVKAEGFLGSIGLITPIHKKFCAACNRIRLTASGKIKPCLCYAKTFDVRAPLRDNDMKTVRETIRKAILEKPEAHHFENITGVTEDRAMLEIGG